jgi:hypothetical protein
MALGIALAICVIPVLLLAYFWRLRWRFVV